VNNQSRFVAAARIATLAGTLTLAAVAVAGEARVPAPRPRMLHFSEFAFDPLQAEPSLPAGWDRSMQMVPDLHLIQFDGPILSFLLAGLARG